MKQGGMPVGGDEMVSNFVSPRPVNRSKPSVPGSGIVGGMGDPVAMTQTQQSAAIPPSVYQQLLMMMKGGK